MEPLRIASSSHGGAALGRYAAPPRPAEDTLKGHDEEEEFIVTHLTTEVERLNIIDPWWDIPGLDKEWSPCPLGRAIFGPLDTQFHECKSYLLTTLLFYKIAELHGCEVEVFGKIWRMVFSWLVEMDSM